ncbi:Ppx-GppA-domain-containing protein [Teratosphaeria nubilosa]|uniref:Ppx-GppA-domain-containing protein n=1 Tax=Teratosphaeria nubilosa TaxID=161662 RepID=A0A6G1LE63_9PEZI|nr:Ppx-GppA-domain-containing protein [Teratosphaeria nubilosa]
MSQLDPSYLQGIVDMGSNGIRFSISSLQPPTERIMPTLYQHRVGISLYDAQYSASGERQPISEETINGVISSFLQFKQTCEDFDVPKTQVVVLATEATRTARNSEDFGKQIKEKVGWDVIMLPKEEEGRVGAMGIASSLPDVSGLVMDLGGGSTQLSWIIKSEGSEEVRMSESGAVSMPYGAAAMSRRLTEAEKSGSTGKLRQEVQSAVKEAYETLKVPQELQDAAQRAGGFTLYLSGGGFRGWGYVLMSRHRVQPYPIPVINGFKASRKEFLGTENVKMAAAASLEENNDEIFRVSERRAGQVPAVAFLVNALAEALPQIKEVRFCQGGVREGYLFTKLPPEIRAQHPVVVATEPFDSPTSSKAIADLLQSAFPAVSSAGAHDDYKSTFTPAILDAFANLVYYHSSHSKDLQATAAIQCTTSGILAGVHGVLHENRTLLALLLCNRWGGEVPPSVEAFKGNLEQLIETPWTLWWINYIGAVAGLAAAVYPAGVKENNKGRLALMAQWSQTDKGKSLLVLQVKLAGLDAQAYNNEIRAIEKVGKKKRWIGGKHDVGHKVDIEIV